jgi:hypothetical protein
VTSGFVLEEGEDTKRIGDGPRVALRFAAG